MTVPEPAAEQENEYNRMRWKVFESGAWEGGVERERAKEGGATGRERASESERASDCAGGLGQRGGERAAAARRGGHLRVSPH